MGAQWADITLAPTCHQQLNMNTGPGVPAGQIHSVHEDQSDSGVLQMFYCVFGLLDITNRV